MKISNLFKDKEKKKAEAEAMAAAAIVSNVESEGEAEGKLKAKGKGKKSAKADKAEASVTHATVEIEPKVTVGNNGDEMAGLSPAAKLARQHTLRSNAADAAKARADRETRNNGSANSGKTPTTWEKNTATRAAAKNGTFGGKPPPQDGSSSEEDEASDDDDEGTYDGHQRGIQQPQFYRDPRHDDDSDSGSEQGYGNEGDVTVRMDQVPEDDEEAWAVGLRRSIERTRTPSKGILKCEPSSSCRGAYS